MTASNLDILPPELLDSILSYLPLSALFAFGRTSKANYHTAIDATTHLELAIFPRRIHSTLAFLESVSRDENDKEDTQDHSRSDNDKQLPSRPDLVRRKTSIYLSHPAKELYQIGIATAQSPPHTSSLLLQPDKITVDLHTRRLLITPNYQSQPPASPTHLRTSEILLQNTLAASILTTQSISHLRSLHLHLYSFTSPVLASTISTCFPKLRCLSLNFCHQYIHDSTLPLHYWRKTPGEGSGSAAWNTFGGLGEGNEDALALTNLKTLELRRAGITETQLRCWVQANCQELSVLKLEKIRGVDAEFVTWLSRHLSSEADKHEMQQGHIEKLWLEDCANLHMNRRKDFSWIDNIVSDMDDNEIDNSVTTGKKKLRELSLKGCKNVNEKLFLQSAIVTSADADDDGYDYDIDEYNKDIDDVDSTSSMKTKPKWGERIYKLTSPEGTVLINGKTELQRSGKGKGIGKQQPEIEGRDRGNSPALTVNDGMIGQGGSWKVGPIEVDPDL